MDTLVNHVQSLRMNADMTQEDLAREIGVSRQTIIAIEKGNYEPSVMLALKIARHFERPMDKVFTIL